MSTGEKPLLDAAIRALELNGWDACQINEILVDAHASRSSLYHFYGSREGLLAAATAERYRRLLLQEDTALVAEASDCETTEEFLAFVTQQIVRTVTDPDSIKARQSRVAIGADALILEELREDVAQKQQLFLDVIAEIVRAGQQKGIIRPDLDAMAYAAWMHGTLLGRTLTEAVFPDTASWLEVAIEAVVAPLRPHETTPPK
ncbi:MAG: TetR/AcrR family transcriptional regulator [Actinomycetes bacterium]